METEQKRLLKRFHTLMNKAGIGPDGKEAIKYSYSVESSKHLTVDDLNKICDELSMQISPKMKDLNSMRGSVIKAISTYHRAMCVDIFQKEYRFCTPREKSQRRSYAMGTAENAAGKTDFNRISLEGLRTVYYCFLKKAKIAETVNKMSDYDLLHRVHPN
jgi:hypothetical protein